VKQLLCKLTKLEKKKCL